MSPSLAFRAIIFGVSTMHFFVCCLTETYFIDGFIDRYVEPKLTKLIYGEHLKYKKIANQLDEDTDWPPKTQKTHKSTDFVLDDETGPGKPGKIEHIYPSLLNGIVSEAFAYDDDDDDDDDDDNGGGGDDDELADGAVLPTYSNPYDISDDFASHA